MSNFVMNGVSLDSLDYTSQLKYQISLFLVMVIAHILFYFFDLVAGHFLTRGFHRKSVEILLERYVLTMFCIPQTC